ncbi:hypothetical protein Q9S36_04880 [Microbacterium sp. ARD31]|uniref:hypothetical protein n=1 Tax=Microbacterium sp. ARD31 TaxID=2962576 RepID=UPI002881326A|nr:hypothetical protein [Microbacterium sp. ARD31]MDT0179544.1 hypothetical protein [Microbacterium sp. ARD31]
MSVSFYTSAQLATGVGTLFGAHLRRDSRVLWDPAGSIAQSVGSMGDVDTARLRRRVKAMTTIFTTPEMDLPKYLEGMVRHARYLLRSSLYSQAIEQGEPCFSVRELEDRLKDPGLAAVLASRRASAATQEELADCLKRLEAIVGAFPANHHGSLEATVVNEWGRRGDILSGAFLVLGSSSSGSVYAEVDKILL